MKILEYEQEAINPAVLRDLRHLSHSDDIYN